MRSLLPFLSLVTLACAGGADPAEGGAADGALDVGAPGDGEVPLDRVDGEAPLDRADGGAPTCESVPAADRPRCALRVGVCVGARQPCAEGVFRACAAADYEAHSASYREEEGPADCDGEDNDCDARIDEACPCRPGAEQPCGQDEGACVAGTQTCGADGTWGACAGDLGPAPEACNGLDDDCDGAVDEGLAAEAALCRLQAGVCAGAREACGGEVGWLACEVALLGAHDARYRVEEGGDDCDGLDNDCDGAVDEGCECRPGEERACGTDVGECRPGRQACMAGRFTPCDAVGPAAETCDGRDQDCDGRTDEGAPCPANEACNGGRCERVVWIFEAEDGAMGHDVGRREAEGWSANTGQDRAGMLVYGPYTRDIPAGEMVARFRLLVDNNVADNNDVVRFEVNDFDARPECGNCIIARRTVRRREFPVANQFVELELPFVSPGAGHRLEFRTYWYDIAYVRQDRVEVRRR